MQSSVASKFYNIFWTNEQCLNLFLIHKEQLLEKEEIDTGDFKKGYYLQRFVLSNSIKRNESLLRIEQRIQNSNIQANHNLEVITNKNINEEKINEYLNKKLNPVLDKISKKLNGGNISQIKFFTELTTSLLSEKRLIKFLQKYEVINKNITSFETLTASIERFFEKEIASLINPEHFIDVATSINELATYYNNYNFNDLIDANKFHVDVLYDKENYKSRIDLFDLLYECEALTGGVYKTYYECTFCGINTFSGNVTLNVTPSKLKLKCPNCNKEVFYLAPYKIDNTIFNDITSKDGLLHAAIIHLLAANKIQYQKNIPIGHDVEIDISMMDPKSSNVTDILEVKMFKNNRPTDTQLANLRQGLKKFITARQKLISLDKNYENVKFHYITNITDRTLLHELKKDFHSELSNSLIFIHDVLQFKGYINDNHQ